MTCAHLCKKNKKNRFERAHPRAPRALHTARVMSSGQYDQTCYNPSLDRVSDGAQHAKAWEEYKTYGTAGRNEDEIEEKTASDRRFTREEEEEEEDQRKNKIVPKEQLIKQKSYGTIEKGLGQESARREILHLHRREKERLRRFRANAGRYDY